MNLLAKIFVVLTLLLSITFLGVTSALYMGRQSLRDEVSRVKKEHLRIEGELEELQKKSSAEIANLNADVKGLKEERTTHVERIGQLDKQNQDLLSTKRTLLANLTEKDGVIKGLEASHTQLTALSSSLKTDLDTARADLKTTREAEERLTAERDQLTADNKGLKLNLESTRRDLAEKTKELDVYVKTVENLKERGIPVDLHGTGVKKPPLVDGKVLVVNEDLNFIIVNVGEERKLKPGHEMVVYRDEGYVTRVVVEKVFKDLSKARILTAVQKLPVQEGDDVTTRISSYN